MFFALLLSSAVMPGQPPASPEPQPSVVSVPLDLTVEVPPAPAPDKSEAGAVAPPAAQNRWALMQTLQGTWYGALLDDNRINIYGWTDADFTASTDRNNQLPMGLNYRANQLQVQQNWLRVERAVDPAATTATWGFRSDTILPGLDGRFTIARGLFDHQLTANNGGPNLYAFDPVQFYGEVYLPNVARGMDVKAGRFFAQFGAESIDAVSNLLASHSYTFDNDPFTHTGVLTTTKLNDAWVVQNGLVTGSDMFIGPEANPTYIGSVKWAPPTGRDSFLFSVVLGDGRYNVDRAFSNPEVFDVVYTHKFNDRLNYTLDALYSFQHNFPGVGASGFVNNYGIVNYLSYQFASNLTGTVRAEVFGDPQGQRTGTRGTYEALTVGVTYKPMPWLWLRPEVRYDHNDGRPYEGHPDLFTAALDFIIRW